MGMEPFDSSAAFFGCLEAGMHPKYFLPPAVEQCLWCLCWHGGVKEKTKVTQMRHEWWGVRLTDGQGKGKDKEPNRKGAPEGQVFASTGQFHLLPSPSPLPLKSYLSLPIGYSSHFWQSDSIESVLDKHFFKWNLLVNDITCSLKKKIKYGSWKVLGALS